MARLVYRSGVLVVLNAAVALLWLASQDVRQNCERWETDANLDVMPTGEQVDVLIAGSSHGWALTACPDAAQTVTELLGADTLNLSKKGCGPLPGLCYLEAFFARENEADAIVYFIDPWAMAYARWNEDAPFLRDEPFDAPFWWRAALNGMSVTQLAAGTRAQFYAGIEDPNDRATWCSRSLGTVQPEAVKRRRDYLYPHAFETQAVSEYAPIVERIAQLAAANGARMLFIIPPTLLGDLAGTDELRELLHRLEHKFDCAWIDASEALADPAHYRDHDHLNAEGVEQLLYNVVQPALESPPA